jgi:hypothetical protein
LVLKESITYNLNHTDEKVKKQKGYHIVVGFRAMVQRFTMRYS